MAGPRNRSLEAISKEVPARKIPENSGVPEAWFVVLPLLSQWFRLHIEPPLGQTQSLAGWVLFLLGFKQDKPLKSGFTVFTHPFFVGKIPVAALWATSSARKVRKPHKTTPMGIPHLYECGLKYGTPHIHWWLNHPKNPWRCHSQKQAVRVRDAKGAKPLSTIVEVRTQAVRVSTDSWMAKISDHFKSRAWEFSCWLFHAIACPLPSLVP